MKLFYLPPHVRKHDTCTNLVGHEVVLWQHLNVKTKQAMFSEKRIELQMKLVLAFMNTELVSNLPECVMISSLPAIISNGFKNLNFSMG